MKLTTPDLLEQLFQTYQLEPKEELEGQQFNAFQRGYLHNLRASFAQQKLSYPFTPEDVIGYAQFEAEMTGKIDLLTALLTFEPPTDESEN